MFDDIYKNIRLSMSERLSSPLMTSFIISWLIWNYRFVLIALSSESIDEKIFLIDTEVFPSWLYMLGKGVLGPLISTLIYIFIYPWPARKVYEYSRNRQKELLEIRKNIESETLLTKEESRKIYFDMAKSEEEHFSEIERLNKEIDRLKGALTHSIQEEFEPFDDYDVSNYSSGKGVEAKNINASKASEEIVLNYKKSSDGEEMQLNESQMKILSGLAKLNGNATEYDWYASLKRMDRVEFEYELEEMMLHNLIYISHEDQYSPPFYRFTQTGRKLYLSNKNKAELEFEGI